MVEMADTADSKSDGASRAGSNPAIGTCRRVEQLEARQPHKLEVTGSSPVPAPLYGLNLKFTGSETGLQSRR